ncbi:MAG: hypothetical protein NTX48_07225 [Planctomycetales bacterium]|nr:hypothetical protein [Planctomycetales bacterium]
MLTKDQEDALVRAVYSVESLNGCIVGYHGGNMSKVLSPGYAGTINFGRTIVVIEEAPPAPSELLILAATNRSGGLEASRPAEDVTNRGRVGRQLVGTGLSCGVAVVTGLSAVGGVIGAPATGGTSLGLTVLAWTGFLTSAAQCAYGIARLNEIRTNPTDDSLNRMDNDPDVQRAVNIVDFLNLASGVATMGIRGVRCLAVLQRNSSRLSETAVRGMTRAQRVAVLTEEITELQKTEAGRRTLEAALREAGATARDIEIIVPRGLNHPGAIRVASAASSAISAPHVRALTEAIRDGLIGIAISATPSSYTGSASGVVNTLIVNVINK